MVFNRVMILCALAWLMVPGTVRASGSADRPVLLHFFVIRGPGAPHIVSVQYLVLKRRAVQQVTYPYPFARWHPRRNIIAFKDDLGLEYAHFSRSGHMFGHPRLVRPTVGPGVLRKNGVDLGPSLLDPAWSVVGNNMVAEFDGRRGIEMLSLASGRRQVIVPARELGNNPRGNTFGVDYSPDAKLIAYCVQGDVRAAAGKYDPERVFDSEDPGLHCDTWLVERSGKRSLLGHGSRPRFSRDGRWLVVLDRADDKFRFDVRLYDLRSPRRVGRVVMHDIKAVCFSRTKDNLVVVRGNGDLVEVDYAGRVRRILATGRKLLKAAFFSRDVRGYRVGPIMRADVDW